MPLLERRARATEKDFVAVLEFVKSMKQRLPFSVVVAKNDPIESYITLLVLVMKEDPKNCYVTLWIFAACAIMIPGSDHLFDIWLSFLELIASACSSGAPFPLAFAAVVQGLFLLQFPGIIKYMLANSYIISLPSYAKLTPGKEILLIFLSLITIITFLEKIWNEHFTLLPVNIGQISIIYTSNEN